MGVFMILCFIVLPSYGKRGEARALSPDSPAPAVASDGRIACLLISYEWQDDADVDLHVIDPQGNHFYFEQPAFESSPALLTHDSKEAGGKEIWVNPAAAPGTYEVYCDVYTLRRGSAATVKMSLMYGQGNAELGSFSLPFIGNKLGCRIASVTVAEDGAVSWVIHHPGLKTST